MADEADKFRFTFSSDRDRRPGPVRVIPPASSRIAKPRRGLCAAPFGRPRLIELRPDLIEIPSRSSIVGSSTLCFLECVRRLKQQALDIVRLAGIREASGHQAKANSPMEMLRIGVAALLGNLHQPRVEIHQPVAGRLGTFLSMGNRRFVLRFRLCQTVEPSEDIGKLGAKTICSGFEATWRAR